MKPLDGSDFFKACRLVKAASLREEVVKAASKVQKGQDIFEAGASLLFDCMLCLVDTKHEASLWELLASPLEMKPEEVAHIPLGELSVLLGELFNQEDTKVFLQRLSNMITTE